MTLSFRPALAALLGAAIVCSVSAPAAQAGTTVGSGHVVNETRALTGFDAIGITGSIDLHVGQGTATSVRIEAEDNLLPLVETVVDGTQLRVRLRRGESVMTRKPIRVTVVLPALTAIASAGSGDIRIDTFDTPALKLGLSGSGDAELKALTTGRLAISLAGSGDVKGRGKAGELSISIAGSGDVSLGDFQADDVSVSIAGSGDAEVQAQKTLAVNIAGSGDVVWHGNATLKRSVVGSGSVSKR